MHIIVVHGESKSQARDHQSNERKGRYKGERYVYGSRGGKQHREGRGGGGRGGRQWKHGEGQWDKMEERSSGKTWSGRHSHWQRREDRKWKKEGETSGAGRIENKEIGQDIIVHEKESKLQEDSKEDQQGEKTRWRRKDRKWDHQRKDRPSTKDEGEKPDEKKTIIKRQAPERESRSCDKHEEHGEPQKDESDKAETQRVVSVESNRHRGDQRWRGSYEGRQSRNNYRRDYYSARRQGSTNGGHNSHQKTDKSGEHKEEVMKLKQHKEEPRSNKIQEDSNA